MKARYGSWSSLGQFDQEAQLQNYEAQRAEFEAYLAHSQNAQSPSTGIVYWQLNKGWPSLLWTLYNNDYDQAGSYFGAQEANRPLHAIYDYGTGGVDVAWTEAEDQALRSAAAGGIILSSSSSFFCSRRPSTSRNTETSQRHSRARASANEAAVTTAR